MSNTPFPTGSPDLSAFAAMPDRDPAPETQHDAELTPEEQDALNGLSLLDVADTTEAPAASGAEPREQILNARIVQVHRDDVFLDLGGKAEGVLPRAQFKEGDEPAIGRVIQVVFDRFDRDSNLRVFSREGAARVATWESLKPGVVVDARVTGMNKGGLEVDMKGIRGFIPGSQCDIDRTYDASLLIGQTVKCQVLEVHKRDNNVLLSRRKLQEHEREESRQALLSELAEGQVRRGVVRNVTEYGAFVDLGGVDGLLHVSDMSWSQVDAPSDVVSPGQEVDVMVLKVKTGEDGRRRISLGLKQVSPDPWNQVPDKYPEGMQLRARVVRVVDFGAFAEVEEGIEALIPVSEMSWNRIGKPRSVVRVGDIVDTVVIRVEPEKRRMALSMKQASPDPWDGVNLEFPQDAVVTGRVTKVAEFGAFVELRPGVEGLVHVSELSDQHVRKPSDVVQPGQEVTIKVLGVDMDQRRVSLSIKAAAAPTPEAAESREPAKTARKRKRPLRGGLGGDDSSGLFRKLLG